MKFCSLLSVLVSFLLLNVPGNSVNGAPDKVVCYVGTWAAYRPGDGNYPLDQIPSDLCTHLVYSFVSANNNAELVMLDSWLDISLGGFQKFNNLKKSNPKLKTFVAMGGWNAGSTLYSNLFSDAGRRLTFARNAVAFMKKHNFDGLDLDWEYPAQRGGSAADKWNFVELCRVLKAELGNAGLLLTAAVGVSEYTIQQSYDVPNLVKYLDWINLMTYDIHMDGPVTGHNAPLYMSRAEANTGDATLNIKTCLDAWIRNGAPASKLVLGVPLYGHSYALSSTSCTNPRCPSSGAGNAGPITQQPGYLGYNEICLNLKNGNARKFWDSEAYVPYYVLGNQWVSYDDKTSIDIKANLIKGYNLGGGMVWSLETDDFRGNCGEGKYPLVNALKQSLLSSTQVTTTTTAKPVQTTTAIVQTTTQPTQTTTKPTQTTVGPSGLTCNKPGYIRDPVDCSYFYQCYLSGSTYAMAKFYCGASLGFDTNLNVCNYKNLIGC